jgi:hypothetical protein
MTGHGVTDTRPAGSVIRSPDAVQAMNARLRAVEARLTAAAPTNIGFPAARDIDYRPLAPLLGHLLNNLGDPRIDPLYPGHVHDLEREVLDFTAELFRAPPGWSGYLTSGGTEGNLYGLWLGRTKLPNAVAYYSSAAHPVDRTNARISGVVRPVLLPARLTNTQCPNGRVAGFWWWKIVRLRRWSWRIGVGWSRAAGSCRSSW